MKSKEFLQNIYSKSRELNKKILFDEFDDERIQKAVKEIKKQGIAQPIIVIPENKINQLKNLKDSRIEIIVIDKKKREELGFKLYEIRKNKITIDQAMELIKEPIYFATMLIKNNEADGLISGANHTTAHTIRPALQIIKTKKPFSVVSGSFFMLTNRQDNQVFVFSDCAVIPNPNEKQLAEIAIESGITAKSFGLIPKIAMLSFSTKGSAKHEMIEKIIKATELAKKINKSENLGFIIDGEMQLDAAIVREIALKKAPNSQIKGNANVFIFPDLNAGNIGYKLVERFSNATAIGPILQGLNKPVNDLSRGCKVEDIIQLAAITSIQK